MPPVLTIWEPLALGGLEALLSVSDQLRGFEGVVVWVWLLEGVGVPL